MVVKQRRRMVGLAFEWGMRRVSRLDTHARKKVKAKEATEAQHGADIHTEAAVTVEYAHSEGDTQLTYRRQGGASSG